MTRFVCVRRLPHCMTIRVNRLQGTHSNAPDMPAYRGQRSCHATRMTRAAVRAPPHKQREKGRRLPAF